MSHDEAMIDMIRSESPEFITEYLNASLETGNKNLLLIALRHVVEAKCGFTKLAQKTGLTRESIYRMLSSKGNPEWSSLSVILKALDFAIRITPLQTPSKKSKKKTRKH